MAKTIIDVRKLEKSFGSHAVLRRVDFSLAEKDSLAIIGGSGTGKSVTLRCLLGLLQPDAGEITILGQTQHGQARPYKQIGMMFQNGALFDSLPVWQNVAFQLWRDGGDADTARAVAKESLRMVGIEAHIMDLYPSALSGGMHKRVGLARAIAARPPILFFDEPTTGLDPIMADLINNLIAQCVQDLGATAITITHDMSSVDVFASHVGLLHNGTLLWQGPVADMADSDNPYLRQFITGAAQGPIT